MFDPTSWVGFHTWLSLIGIASGFLVLADLIAGRDRPWVVGVFLASAFATSATGFGFPFAGVLPSHIVGGIALLILAATIPARYLSASKGHAGSGRSHRIYAVGAVASLYLLVFVAVAQAFAKIPALQAMAPTQSEPPFAIVQGVVLLIFGLLGVAAVRGRMHSPRAAA
ncbi:hypothetical protein [Ancylobacter oerskovii]|uniref:DUF998 domain-containing protein n=1 Tax=Ancylobacter oerskovii TaxID=459519 RepID=A0ABW4YRZ5_9HYPH|nr:hypothetical protein [Ancylobacter oerskovii]MBS7545572.1 hypothetical protein [Ancylobacter oerskovii]